MDFEEWEPAYQAIRRDFGYDRAADRRGRDVLAGLVPPFDEGRLPDMTGATVGIAGAAPRLTEDLGRLEDVDVVVAASAAVQRLRTHGISVDLMVTDLDKTPETARTLTREGVPVAVHGHGDNIPILREEVPTFDTSHVLATTQVEPVDHVKNYGGFTDGDRSAFLADEFGAATLQFAGWDFKDPTVSDEKRRKLVWAARLLRWLEIRRDEHFRVLQGYRDELTVPWLD